MPFGLSLLKRANVAACVCAAGLALSPLNRAQVYSDQAAVEGVLFTNTTPPDVLHTGAGGAWGDYDGDGDLDIYLATRQGSNALFENLGRGLGFADRAAEFGVDDPANEALGALFGDYDDDGDCDLYLLNRGDNILFRNDGPDGGSGWNFTDVTSASGVMGFGRSESAALGDLDNDGFLDLYVANHNFPTTFPQNFDLRADQLYHSIADSSGGRVFEDWSVYLDPAIMQFRAAHSVAMFDMDVDGDLDIFVVNESLNVSAPIATGENFLWQNEGTDGLGGWTFNDIAPAANMDWRGAPMGIAIGDYDGDGDFDAATSEAGPNHLYQAQGPSFFIDVAQAAGVARPFVPSGGLQISWGLVFTDSDLDGWEDLYVPCGGAAGSTNQENALFMNDGNPPNNTFTEVSSTSGADLATSNRTAVRGDYDGDGDEDILVSSLGDVAYLLRNDQVGGDYLGVDLTGTVSNRDAVGSIIRITVSSMTPTTQMRLVISGSSTGGGHALRQTFGVTGATQVDSVEVTWPSGKVSSVRNVAINQVIAMVEPGSRPNVWSDRGSGLAGTGGQVPALFGSGPLSAGSVNRVTLENALPGSITNLVVGLLQDNAPFKGGILVPSLDAVFFGLPVDATGEFVLPFSWISGVPAGTKLYMQHWVSDAGGPFGFAASNCLQGETQ